MTNEKGSDDPSDETKTQSSSEAPMVPPTPQQTEVGIRHNRDPSQEQQETAKLRRDFRTAEKWIIGTNIGLGVIGVIALFIYYGQLIQMRAATEKAGISADAAKRSADLMRQQLVGTQAAIIGMIGAPGFGVDGGWGQPNRITYVAIRLQNTGHVIAQDVHIKIDIVEKTLPKEQMIKTLSSFEIKIPAFSSNNG